MPESISCRFSHAAAGFGVFALVALCLACGDSCAQAAEGLPAEKLYARDNLVAWCIVPFDAKKRGPEDRAAMLARLGFRKFAYDWRAEHLPTFDDEIKALAARKIELTAVWFPAALNDDARQILGALKRHTIRTQLWVTMGDPAPGSSDDAAKLQAAVQTLHPIVEAAGKQGCSVGLYNHGGWFGQPENQLAVVEQLNAVNVGIVYNLHHGHEHLDRFAELLKRIRPHLYAINLNGMVRAGDERGQKILQLGQGEMDLEILRTIVESGYAGPIGILGHTDDDAEARLLDNLDGLDWLVRQLAGKNPGERPRTRTPVPTPTTATGQQSQLQKQRGASDQAAFDPELVAGLAADAKKNGDAGRGAEVFGAAKFACISCHQVGHHGGTVGPALTEVGRTLSAEQLAEALLSPSRQVKPEYSAWQVTTTDGRVFQGYKRKETEQQIEILEPTSGKTLEIARDQIDELQEIGSLMPTGLATAMSTAERRDLVRFLMELGHTDGLADAVSHRHEHTPAEFVFNRAPLRGEEWPHWQHHVNRDRVYDFYTKEAEYFRRLEHRPSLLPPFPGLDGGKQGHWGNQNEDVWRDDRWNKTDLGVLLSGVFHGYGKVVPKGVCVRLGDAGELSACFNPETLRYEALWRGGFVKFSDVRHGFMDGLRAEGEMLPRPEEQHSKASSDYRGFYRFGKRVIFAYRAGRQELLDSAWVQDGKFVRAVAPASEHPLKDALRGGPAQWPQEFTVQGTVGSNEPYALDTIPLPTDNPWKALLFIGDHDFMSDGSAMLCTMQGDVWRVTGLDEKLEQVRWRRFASGLHQPLGLVVHDDQVFVLGRDQITRLHDLNHDGEADFYECVSNQMVTSPSGHDFTCGLARDAAGRFYTASGKEGLIRISTVGKNVDALATGLRNADGVGIAYDGAITVPSSEGEWTPASMICLVKPQEKIATAGGVAPHFGYGGPQNGRIPDLPLVYLPRGLDNSSGGQIAVPDDRWGPLKDQLIHFSFGAGSHFLVLRDEVNGQAQGAVVPLVGEFRSGAHRGRFNPKDGQLYVSGMAGWGSYTPDDGCFHRVRYSGKPVQLPRSFHVHENGVLLTFSLPVDRKTLEKRSNHFAQIWNYRYSPGYGSPELSTRHPGVIGHDHLDIADLHVIDDRTVFVELPDLQPVSQLHLFLQADAGRPQELFATVHRLDKPYTDLPHYRANPKVVAAHPMTVDVASLGKSEPNPWRKKIAGARIIRIEAGQNLTFSPRVLKAKSGEPLGMKFVNPDVVPHNWVLVKPASLARMGDLANKLIADPEAVLRQYVPKTDDVLAYTDIVAPKQEFTVYFRAPETAGRYPFLCTFPGHWMVMNGQLIVE
jgi:putative heme-binding domain-containing protein